MPLRNVNLLSALQDCSFTKKNRIIKATNPGIIETQKTSLTVYPRKISKLEANNGPTIAPDWSSVLCNPKAAPLCSSGVESHIRASLGAVLIPFPTLSNTLIVKASNALSTKPKKGLMIFEIP